MESDTKVYEQTVVLFTVVVSGPNNVPANSCTVHNVGIWQPQCTNMLFTMLALGSHKVQTHSCTVYSGGLWHQSVRTTCCTFTMLAPDNYNVGYEHSVVLFTTSATGRHSVRTHCLQRWHLVATKYEQTFALFKALVSDTKVYRQPVVRPRRWHLAATMYEHVIYNVGTW